MERVAVINDAITLLQFPSVYDDSQPEYPFGQSNYECLVYFTHLCEQAGLKVYLDPGKKFAFADTPGPITTAILGHLDVVDTGDLDAWLVPPFSGAIIENKLYGRGAQDMKVPMVIILHVLKDLLAEGHEFHQGIRFIIGSDEECGFECMKAYERDFAFPQFGFTPDGEFGVGNIETSLIEYDVYGDEIVDFTICGGVGYNTVPDQVTYQGKKCQQLMEILQQQGTNYEYDAENQAIIVFGQAVHVCEIERGVNAIQLLIQALIQCGETCQLLEYIQAGFGVSTNSEGINGPLSDQFCGNLASNVGIIEVRSGYQRVGMDLRIPILIDEALLLTIHQNFAESYHLRFAIYFNDRKLYVDPKAAFVQKLVSSYEQVVQQPCQFLATRGGSYAKVAPNYASFGALLTDLGEVSTVHQVNEHYDLRYLEPTYQIYYQAIKEITAH
ncbi:MAG: Sapep family Mn(2+)-dependent dipeptidase [Culicoidibacterales bacterium]